MYRNDRAVDTHLDMRQSIQLASLQKHLSDSEIEDVCRAVGHRWRRRELPPAVMVRSMVYRSLNPDRSIAAVLADLAARWAPAMRAPSDSAWCQARSRLPEAVLAVLIRRQARRSRDRFGRTYQWHGRPVFIIDGSTVSMPDEPALAEAFGYANSKHGPSRFPVARITFIEVAGVQSIWNYRLGEYTCSEEAQLHAMWHTLPAGSIALLDRKFGTFYTFAKLRQFRVDVVTRLHQRRKPDRLIRDGRRLGPDDWVVTLTLDDASWKRYDDSSLPRQLQVRLIRVLVDHGRQRQVLWLVTTMMDPQQWPSSAVAQLYRERWAIEPRIGSIKTTLQMNVLRGKSPDAVRREVAATILGHNLVWTLIHEAAEHTATAAQDISFAGAVKTVLRFSDALTHARPHQRRRVYLCMLDHIARQTNHHPFDRIEPRMIKRDPVRYPFLQVPRKQARLKCLT